jgi:hypothetical protein
MIDPKALERLTGNRDFLAFMEEVYAIREQYIRNMHDLDTARLQQISGRILAYDQVCELGDLQKMRDAWRRLEG